ncbi:ATP-binding cassette domain-containing protein [Fictibacillus sp. WQ 8-8]|uniref:ABC transporter ATP-binding protein n=1 Tax=unclassified Fictibacillus TaxID=2644029 RepID=UPI00210E5A00|nr:MULTISPECIES: ATP-binding cassette domain-containing protein [unclassified Fictibacillus]MCQ6266841.1 ATP-binding cassette domain-containing protein [Fictibacillus sp. WQ 8-8]MED2973874.1 ATP-binding cassette domain-containing protein [Fictibacillus sp. B-59209]
MALELQYLHKSFGHTKAVSNLSLTLPAGEVLGLLGRNGAGKTTTIKMILGLLVPDQGEILWKGSLLDRSQVSIGYLPEERGLYQKSKVSDQLRYFAELEGMDRQSANKAIDYWLEKLQIPEHKDKKASDLSKGNQQKIQLIATLIHDPELLILDEPFSGLDPVNANMLSAIIEEQVKKKKTVILSSHRMEQIESFCENVCLMKDGQAVIHGRLSEIKQNYGYRNLTLFNHEDMEEKLKAWKVSYEKKMNDLLVKVKDDSEAFELFNRLHQANVPIRYFKMLEPTLNEIFLEKVR